MRINFPLAGLMEAAPLPDPLAPVLFVAMTSLSTTVVFLDLSYSNIDDMSFARLALNVEAASRVKVLSIANCWLLSGASLRHLTKFDNLGCADISGLTDDNIAHYAFLMVVKCAASLQYLNIANNTVDETDLNDLFGVLRVASGLVELDASHLTVLPAAPHTPARPRWYNIQHTNLKRLNISYTEVTLVDFMIMVIENRMLIRIRKDDLWPAPMLASTTTSTFVMNGRTLRDGVYGAGLHDDRLEVAQKIAAISGWSPSHTTMDFTSLTANDVQAFYSYIMQNCFKGSSRGWIIASDRATV